MIIEGIFNLIKSVILFVIGLFPALPNTDFLSQSLSPLINVLSSVNSFVSVSLFAGCCAVLIVFLNIDFFWGVIMWVVRKIPGVS